MNWTKEKLQKALNNSFNKREVLLKLGKSGNDYKTLDKYLKLYNLDFNHLKPRSVNIINRNELRPYKKGDKHTEKDLYFWQYRGERIDNKSYEQWYNKEQYEKANDKHKKHNYSYVRKDVLAHITRTSLTSEKLNKRHKDGEELITIEYIKFLWESQKGICYWLDLPMSLEISNNKEISLLKVSVDRINSNRGYTKDNVVLCTQFANKGKGNCSYEKWIEFIKLLKTKNAQIF